MYLKPGMFAFLVACNCGKKAEEDTASEEPMPLEDSASEEDTAEEVLEETGSDTGADTAEEEE